MLSSAHKGIAVGPCLVALGALALMACGGAPAAGSAAAPVESASPSVGVTASPSAAPSPSSSSSAGGDAPAVSPAQAPSAGATGVIVGQLTGKPKHLQQALVYVSDLAGEPAGKDVELDQKGQTFIPHVLPVVKGSTVAFANSDATGHNVFSPDGEKYDLGTFGLGETRKYRFDREGVYTQLCKLHPSMLAYIVVVKNRYFAFAGADGSFRIEGVPVGDRVVEAWQEKARGAATRVTVTAGQEVKVDLAMVKQ